MCQNSRQGDGVAREGMKEKGIRRKAASSRREGGRQNWNFFARAATQQLIKSLNVSLSGWWCCCCPSLALFSQYKLSLFPHFACRLTTAPFSTHPDTAQPPRHPSRDAYGWQLLPREIRGLLRSSLHHATPRDIVNFTCVSSAKRHDCFYSAKWVAWSFK